MLCRCIQILAQVSEVLSSSSIVFQIIAAWLPGVSWMLTNNDRTNPAYYEIQSRIYDGSPHSALISAMKDTVSSNDAICKCRT